MSSPAILIDARHPLDQVEKYDASEVKKPSREQAQELIGKVWDSYSTALGILEQGVVAPFKQLDTLTQTQKNEFATDFPILPEQLENFSQKHEQTTKELANPGLPLALERLYRYASLKMPIHTGKITQTFKGEGSITQNLNPHLGALDRVAGTVSIKKSTPTKVTNPLENISTTTMTKSIKENHLFFQDNAKIVDQMTNLVGINHTGTQKALKEMLVLQRNALIQKGVQQSMSPQVKKNKVIQGLRTMRDRYHNLTQAKSAEFSITHAGGQTQKIKLASTAESTGSMGWPHLMKSNNLGVSASLHRNRNLAYTKTEITMMGPEFTQNLSNFKNMEEFGLDKTALKSIKENMMHPDGRNTDALKAQFAKFFESAQINPPIRQHYFGMNALGEFLMQFSDIKTEEKVEKDDNGSFKLSGFNLFHQNVTDSYFEKKISRKTFRQKYSKRAHGNKYVK